MMIKAQYALMCWSESAVHANTAMQWDTIKMSPKTLIRLNGIQERDKIVFKV